ncbi:DUF6671 family protein [Glaciecola sp. SC05]|uniref:DUF6671 family protein n=1 Tax=Glaciecola sp. SC05 TaxID=1987355 RepID=UPI003526EA19
MTASHFTIQPRIALLTKHGKQDILQPILASEFNTSIIHTDSFDTDSLGTFDRRVERTLSPVGAALKKAYLACELTGSSQGIGSEGSFNSFITGATVNKEVLAFVDLKLNLEVIGFAEQFIGLQTLDAKNEVELGEKMQPFIERFGHAQKWMLYQNESWQKGLAFSDLLPLIQRWPCTIEPDFRAMNCPPRQQTIEMAARNLIECLKSHCPKCDAVNFVKKYDAESVQYLRCEFCASNTSKLAPAKVKCDNCGHIEHDSNAPETASMMYCMSCNP